jgi:hypothetical protein
MGRSADTQGANQPDHDGNNQYPAKNAAKAGPAIHAVTIVATASEQRNQQGSIARASQKLNAIVS